MIASARIASSTTYRESSTSCRSSCTCCRIVFVPNRHVRRTSHGRRRDLDEHTSRQRRRQPRVCSTQWGSRRMDARWTLPGRNRAAGARAARRPAWAASGSASWQRDALILTASSIRKGSPVRVRSWALNNLRANGASCRSRPLPDKGKGLLRIRNDSPHTPQIAAKLGESGGHRDETDARRRPALLYPGFSSPLRASKRQAAAAAAAAAAHT